MGGGHLSEPVSSSVRWGVGFLSHGSPHYHLSCGYNWFGPQRPEFEFGLGLFLSV